MPTLLASSRFLWLLLALPGIYWFWAYWQGIIFYGEFIHASGVMAVRLLILTLSVSAVGLLLPGHAFTRWLRRNRRYLGVAVFAYSLLHTLVYLQRQPLERILAEMQQLAMWTGWLALLVFLALAATSNNPSLRLLGKKWKLLHRLVYPAAALSLAHWVLTAFDPTIGYLHLGILAAVILFRVAMLRRAN
ncbi:MAG: ferric reductase-like transmembrane domain-containing protein [Pseudohongiellaceae bacterium]